MSVKKEEARWSRGGFTLIELLIVVAIIAILALIAVPNFLEAQARAKVSRAKTDIRTIYVAYQAYIVDWNDPLRDANDWDSPGYGITSWYREHSGETPDMLFYNQGNPYDNWMSEFYTMQQWRPLSTPVAYITSLPIQAFSKNVPYGQDTRAENSLKLIYYWVILCGGPDRDNGDWYRANNAFADLAIPYDPSNGTVSNGDIWRGEQWHSTKHFALEYGPWPMSP